MSEQASASAEGESAYSSSSENDELLNAADKAAVGAKVAGASQSATSPSTTTTCSGPSAEGASQEAETPQTGTGYPMIYPPPRHLWTCPPYPEPLNELKEGIVPFMTTHDNKRSQNPSLVLNRVVYDSIEPNPASKVKTPLAPGEVRQYYEPTGPDDDTLIFESRFESGNLRRAIQIYQGEYDLILRPDINTRGHTQWYYFSVSNMRKGRKYKLNIINMMKPDSVYNQGLRPLAYSNKEAEATGIGWYRIATDIAYYANSIKRKNGSYYTLTLTVSFPHEQDTCYMAHCYPFTYSDLQSYLARLEADSARANRFRRRTLCQTLAGNKCELITITSFNADPAALKARKGILISARVHPGETQASWMMKGLIDYLTGPTLDAKILRDHFVIKLVPMLNPDGVVNGNYRCSLSGQDLNRQWLEPSRALHPTIFYTKMMLKRFCQDRQVVMYCDLHGHSRKKNVFIYGCDSKYRNQHQCGGGRRLRERIFPRMLWKNAETFSFSDCSFKVQRCKETTGRVVVWRECDIPNSYTLEASFAGANFGVKSGLHMNTADFEAMGVALCDTMLDFWDPDQSKVEEVYKELCILYPDKADDKGSDSGEDSSSDDEGAARAGKKSEAKERSKASGKGKGGRDGDKRLTGVVQRALESRKPGSAAVSSGLPGGGGGGKGGAGGGGKRAGGKGGGKREKEDLVVVDGGGVASGKGERERGGWAAAAAAAAAAHEAGQSGGTACRVPPGREGLNEERRQRGRGEAAPEREGAPGAGRQTINYSKSLMTRITQHVSKLAPNAYTPDAGL